jgi:hypothetical protein
LAKKVHLKNIGRGCPAAYFAEFRNFTYTDDHSKVTCLLCKKQIRLHNLKNRSEFEKIPRIKAKRWGDLAIVFCPVCGRKNIHGWKNGHRIAHCNCWEDGYDLICNE